MVRSKIAFQQSADANVLASLQVIGGLAGVAGRPFTITEYPDENELLEAIVLAKFDDDTTVELISRILLAVTGSPQEKPWASLIASLAVYSSMGLHMPQNESASSTTTPSQFLAGIDLHVALEQTPVPLCLLEGPEHKIVFVNDAFVKISGRRSQDQMIGKTVREAYSATERQLFLSLLDNVYRTGEHFVGSEVPVSIHYDSTGQTHDNYYDFVYHPIRDAEGRVGGILTQAADVTERVLDKQVREAREKQLYEQWAELDILYRNSPLGMMLLRASDLTIQRINEIEAVHLGGKAQDLLGRRIEDFYPKDQFVGDVLRRVIRDRTSCTLEITAAAPSTPARLRKWTWNLNPILNAVGEVESIASVVLEIADHPNDPNDFLEQRNQSSARRKVQQ